MSADRILIVADDLSGAADCALGGLDNGLETVVICEALPVSRRAEPPAAQVLAIDADSRRRPAEEAARLQADILRRYRADGQLRYKKIDSTLRGHLAHEILPWLRLAGMAIVAPAFPALGRTTIDGRQFVRGVALQDTPMWRGAPSVPDPLPAELAAQGIRCRQLSLDRLRQDPSSLGDWLSGLQRDGVQAVVCDAETDDDLERLACASVKLGSEVCWVGSAGLLKPLARAARIIPRARQAASEIGFRGSIVTVVGSVAEASRIQAERLRASGAVVCLAASPEILPTGFAHSPRTEAGQKVNRDVERALSRALNEGKDVLLITNGDMAGGEELPDGAVSCRSLGALLAPHAAAIGALVLTGGETARTVLSAMGIDTLRPLRELGPGIPLMLAECGRMLPVITKAGAFGAPDALMRCHGELARTHAAGRPGALPPHP
ncbi:four-carbon acid sugar kinase family protein [Noviherbaspirillum galbum]|uniref:Four-carbon acid sugar kinase family protein n=1 Tax=Noviherbaspirillum galbum TaxID=2709383 RepID=A0A6B3SZV4_9BURK|nr:four-carbon acid sugar kinase family protein [Noviherbaspirillum galbum]NEX64719.1 four-carbon acid sugar kinase family protein [Noviherbaspirillum galbum]